jgi:sigma-B regulation protein RsbU (phosphoserine phosphatase)
MDKQTQLAGMRLQDITEEFVSVVEMQRHLMPDVDRITAFGDFDIVGKTLPTAVIGGDFHTFIDLESRFGIKGKMGVVIADASGHGLAAAMLIRDFNTALHMAISFQSFYVQDTTPLLFTKLNRRLYRSSEPHQFITAFYSELHLDGTIRYINAGHPSPRIYKSDGSVVALKVGGPVLGAFPDPPYAYQVGEAALGRGDVMVCCTDGINEAVDPAGAEYGFDRLERVVRNHSQRDSALIEEAILHDLHEFTGGASQQDDRTLIVVKRVR